MEIPILFLCFYTLASGIETAEYRLQSAAIFVMSTLMGNVADCFS